LAHREETDRVYSESFDQIYCSTIIGIWQQQEIERFVTSIQRMTLYPTKSMSVNPNLTHLALL